MSLILDALKKAENERNGEPETPSIPVHHSDTTLDKKKHRVAFLFLFLAIVFVSTMLYFFIFSAKNSEENSIELVEIENDSYNLPLSSSSGAGAGKSSQSVPEFTASNTPNVSKVTNLESSPTLEKETKQPSAPIPSKNRIVATTKNSAEIEKLYANNTEIQDLDRSSNIEEEKIETQSAQPTKDSNSLAHYDSVKHIKELTFSAQESIRTLIYSEHAFSENSNRFVVINGKKIREGEQVNTTIKLDKILKDGALFTFDGTQFKMRAMNSWLNY